MKYRSKEKVIA